MKWNGKSRWLSSTVYVLGCQKARTRHGPKNWRIIWKSSCRIGDKYQGPYSIFINVGLRSVTFHVSTWRKLKDELESQGRGTFGIQERRAREVSRPQTFSRVREEARDWKGSKKSLQREKKQQGECEVLQMYYSGVLFEEFGKNLW